MFGTWGRIVARHPWAFIVATLAVSLVAAPFAARTSGVLVNSGWFDPGTESARVQQDILARFGKGQSSLLAIYRADDGRSANDLAVAQSVTRALEPITKDPRVVGVATLDLTHSGQFISTDFTRQYAVISLSQPDSIAASYVPEFRQNLRTAANTQGLTVQVTGVPALDRDLSDISERDLRRIELFTLPAMLVILFLVFGSLPATVLPLVIALLSILTTTGIVSLIARATDVSVFVTNLVAMLGLALATDYSLFIVSRFKQEVSRGHDPTTAIAVTMAVVGKAISVSGLIVAVGLAGMMFFPIPAMRSLGLCAVLIVAVSVLYANTLLPALLVLLGPKINRLSLRRPAGAQRPPGRARWEGMVQRSMRHPVRVALLALGVLALLGLPVVHLNLGGFDPQTQIPPGYESRDAYSVLVTDFPTLTSEATLVEVREAKGRNLLTAEHIPALIALTQQLARLPNVARVDGPTTWRPGLSVAQWQEFYGGPLVEDPRAQQVIHQFADRDTVLLAIYPRQGLSPAATRGIAAAVRRLHPPPGMIMQVGGRPALELDFIHGVVAGTPWTILITVLVTLVVVFLSFASATLPFKAVVVSFLSIAASFGALVWVFQDGHGAGLLHYHADGATFAAAPALLFSLLFTISTDYEIVLLAQIQEAYRRTSDNTSSVVAGVVETAQVITGAASVMIVVFAGFALGTVSFFKALGTALAIAVAVDAVVVRIVLVPAMMALMGTWNWWVPAWIGRLPRPSG